MRQDLSNYDESLHHLRTSALDVLLNYIFGLYVPYSSCTVKSILFNNIVSIRISVFAISIFPLSIKLLYLCVKKNAFIGDKTKDETE